MLSRSASQASQAARLSRTIFSKAKSASVQVPMTDPLPQFIQSSEGSSVAASAPSTRVTTLSNGVRVASTDMNGELSSFGMFFAAGSRSETAANSGASHLIERLAFKGTSNRSHFLAVRELEKVGAQASVSASREEIAYSATTLRGNVAPAFEVLAESALLPRFQEHEVEQEKANLLQELREFASNPQLVLAEALHTAAFRGSSIGNPLICPPHNINKLSPSVLRAFQSANFIGGNLVVAATNVNHEELVALATSYFQALPSGSSSFAPSRYTGGENRFHETRALDADESIKAHAALAFKGVGLKDASLPALSVLQAVLGGGSNSYSGSVGYGNASRLNANIVAQNSWVHTVNAFNLSYSDAGLFGVHMSAEPTKMESLLKSVISEVKNSGSVSEEELSRAKAKVRTSVLANLEKSSSIASELATSIRVFGRSISASELASQVESVSVADLKRAADAVLQSQPTFVSFGEVSNVPYLDQLSL